MTQQETKKAFDQWCVIELFGHNKIAGRVTEETIGGCAFLRVDVPDETGETTAFTKYFGQGAVYAMNVTDKTEVLKVVGYLYPKPPVPRVSNDRLLAAHNEADDDDTDWDDE